MEETTLQLLIIAVTGLFGGGLVSGIAALVRGRSGAAKDIAEAAATQVEQYRKQVSELTCELEQVKDRLSGLEKIAQILDEVIAGAHLLVHQVKSLRAIPVYIPPERRDDLAASVLIRKKSKKNGRTGAGL